jgi:hypothetical protein
MDFVSIIISSLSIFEAGPASAKDITNNTMNNKITNVAALTASVLARPIGIKYPYDI